MKSFIISGIVGSSIFALLLITAVAATVGLFAWAYLLYELPFGLLGGLAGYGIHKLLPSTSETTKRVMIGLSGIMGFGFSILIYTLLQ
jgi:hypothetical protein